MKHTSPCRFAGPRGFTLVESILVVVVLGIAAAAIVTMQGNMFRGQTSNYDMLVGAQLMQECAEHILETRRSRGFSDNTLANSTAATASCSGMNVGGYGYPTVTVATGNSPGLTGCPSSTANSCKQITVQQGGLASITLMLANY